MSTDLTYKATATRKFLLVGVATLTFVGLALFFLTSTLNGIQKLIEGEVVSQYQTLTLNYPLEQLVFDLEKDIHKIAETHFHSPQSAATLGQEILAEIATLKQLFAQQDNDNRLELLNDYEEIFRGYIAQHNQISQTLLNLEETQELFLQQLEAMEQKTGAQMVEYTLAGQDTTVLRQMFAIIAFCREQVLTARYAIGIEAFTHTNRQQYSAVQTLALDAFASLGRTLDTLTGGFVEISAHANLLIEQIAPYQANVTLLHAALKRYNQVQHDLEAARAALVAVLEQSRKNMLNDMDLLQESTQKLSRRALMVTGSVSVLVLCALVLAWLILSRFGQRVECGMLVAIELKQELEEKNQALIHEIAAREGEENTRKQLEAQLQQAQKMEAIGTLAGGIAHDFNNLLAAIIGYTELALMRTIKGRDTSRELGEIKKAGMRAKKLTEQILAFSRSNEQSLAPVQLVPIAEEAIRLLQATLPATIEVTLRVLCPAKSLVVLADQTQLHQILMNLCTNAFHAMRGKGGTLDVILDQTEITTQPTGTSLPSGRYVKMLVKDSGCGIDPVTLERIFEPYFTTKGQGEGTGMGLAVVHGIVRAHNGAISCLSKPDVGSSFEVLLPLVTDVIDPEVPQREEEVSGGKERILLVDDEAVIVAAQQEMLGSLGYQLTTALESLRALEIFSATPDQFDLVITDMTMPQLTGADLARKMLAIRPDLPILMCTGFSDQIDEKKAEEIGIRGFLIKPVSLQKLTGQIRQLLDQT